eukprot:7012710-Prymnesium_polylepis.1
MGVVAAGASTTRGRWRVTHTVVAGSAGGAAAMGMRGAASPGDAAGSPWAHGDVRRVCCIGACGIGACCIGACCIGACCIGADDH